MIGKIKARHKARLNEVDSLAGNKRDVQCFATMIPEPV